MEAEHGTHSMRSSNSEPVPLGPDDFTGYCEDQKPQRLVEYPDSLVVFRP